MQTGIQNYIRYYRLKKGWSQAKLAEELHLTPQAIHHYEAGSRSVSVELLQDLSKVLGFSTIIHKGEIKMVSRKLLEQKTEWTEQQRVEATIQEVLEIAQVQKELSLQELIQLFEQHFNTWEDVEFYFEALEPIYEFPEEGKLPAEFRLCGVDWVTEDVLLDLLEHPEAFGRFKGSLETKNGEYTFHLTFDFKKPATFQSLAKQAIQELPTCEIEGKHYIEWGQYELPKVLGWNHKYAEQIQIKDIGLEAVYID